MAKGDFSLFYDPTLSFGSANRRTIIATAAAALVSALALLSACQPTVRVEAPKEPITINLNVKLDAEVRLKLEEQAREEVEANPDIF